MELFSGFPRVHGEHLETVNYPTSGASIILLREFFRLALEGNPRVMQAEEPNSATSGKEEATLGTAPTSNSLY